MFSAAWRSFFLCTLALTQLLGGCGSDCPHCPKCLGADSTVDTARFGDAALDVAPGDLPAEVDTAGPDTLPLDVAFETMQKDAAPGDLLLDAGDAASPDAAPSEAGSLDGLAPDLLAPDLGPPKEEACADGQDNDGDTLADCADPDCDQRPCREQMGLCDEIELCSGQACPADQLKPAKAVCRPGGPCDIEEKCDGVSLHCPVDELAPPTAVCRASAGLCDSEEYCDGMATSCPPDELYPADHVCRPPASDCDAEELCDGTTIDCPDDLPAPATAVCRPAVADCDKAELCNGTSFDCGDDLIEDGTKECRPSTGGCDSAEFCDGVNTDCPTDLQICPVETYCDGTLCMPQKELKETCSEGIECKSGHCEDGFCCDQACSGPCRSCKESGKEGTCINHPDLTNPENGCGYYNCNGKGSCYLNCSYKASAMQTYCNSTAYCDRVYVGKPYQCTKRIADGGNCDTIGGGSCQSGFCWNNDRCCATSCHNCCGSCLLGTCKPEPQDKDHSCSNYRCDGKGGTYTTCTKDGWNCAPQCTSKAWCWDGACLDDLDPGAGCLGGCQCKSDICAFFFCW